MVRLAASVYTPSNCSYGTGDDLVGGFGQLGEAVGQAVARQDEGVGVGVFGLAEFGQQVQVLGNVL